MMTTTWAIYFVLATATGRPTMPWEVPVGAWVGLIGIGVISTAIAIQTFYAGTRRVGAAQAALISTVEPIYTITLAVLLFGETLTTVQLLGGALVIIGVIVAQTAPPSGRRDAALDPAGVPARPAAG